MDVHHQDLTSDLDILCESNKQLAAKDGLISKVDSTAWFYTKMKYTRLHEAYINSFGNIIHVSR